MTNELGPALPLATFDLLHPFIVTDDVLEQTFPTKLGGAALHVRFPRVAPVVEESYPVTYLEIVGAPGADVHTIAQIDAHEVRVWQTCVHDWLCAWLGIPRLKDVSVPAGVQLLNSDGTRTTSGGGLFRPVGYGGGIAATSDQIRESFGRGADLTPLPPEHALLVHARDARSEFEMRVSVIDACGAAEIALEQEIRRQVGVSGASEAVGNALVRRATGLRRLHELYCELGGTRFGQLDILGALRNQAAHRGAAPSVEESNSAISSASRVVHRLSPLQYAPRVNDLR